MSYKCPECGAIVAENAKYCEQCGCPINYIKTHQFCDNSHNSYDASSDMETLQHDANLGIVEAMFWLAYRLYVDEFEDNEAKVWLLRAIERGHEDARAKYEEWFEHDGQTVLPNTTVVGIANDYPLKSLFEQTDSIIFYDFETSGLNPVSNRIIEIAAIKVKQERGFVSIVDEMDEMIQLPTGTHLDNKITDITGITDDILRRAGKNERFVFEKFVQFLGDDRKLLVAYNAQFDLSFLYQLLCRFHSDKLFNGFKNLDALTVYKDRHEYPHRLENAIELYRLENVVQNSHRAIDDVYSLFEVLKAMDKEYDDLNKYINLFGYHPKYGINGLKLPGIKYLPQPYNAFRKLYE